MRTIRTLVSALLVPVSLALAGCGLGASGTAMIAGAPAVQVGGLARLDEAIAGQRGRPLLLNFWATWCPPCVAELPELVAVVREHESGGLQVLGVSFDMMLPGKEPDEVITHVRTFLEQRGLVLPTVVLDRADYKSIRARYDLPDGIPVTLAIDRAGNVVDRHEGQGAREDFERLARKALGR
jgi:thiol-disulfide isomerase/thioredoxin